jgi:MFS family permease
MQPEPEHEVSSISLSAYVRLVSRNRNFRRLWLAQIVSEIGDWFYTLAIYSLLLQLTGRASSVALALVLQVLPQTFMGPMAGVVNDRLRRKRVMIAADLARVAIVLAMLLVRSRSTVWMVYPLLLLETIMAAFFEPARNSVVPNITSRQDVILANTLSSTTWSLNLMVGATLGGVIAALFGRDAVFLLNALSFLASALLIRGMRFREPHVESASPLRFRDLLDLSPVAEGVRYVRRDRRLLAAVFVKAGLLMVGVSWVLFTVMAQRIFPLRLPGIDPPRGMMLGMSLLLGARGLGALLGLCWPLLWPAAPPSDCARESYSAISRWPWVTPRWAAPPMWGWPACAWRWRTAEAQLYGSSPPPCCNSTPKIVFEAAYLLLTWRCACSRSRWAPICAGGSWTGASPPAWSPLQPAC